MSDEQAAGSDAHGSIATWAEFGKLTLKQWVGEPEAGAWEFYGLAGKAYEAGQLDLAERSLRKATHLSPLNVQLHLTLGRVTYQRGRLSEAERSFQEALAVDPESVEALLGMAVTLHGEGRESDAVYFYLRYLNERPDDVGAMVSLAAVFQSTGQNDEAVELFQRASALDPESPDVAGLYGRALLDMGRDAKGLELLRKSVDLDSQDSEVYRALGSAVAEQGDPAGARAYYERAIELEPRNAAAHLELASILNHAALPDDGVEHATRAVAILREEKGSEEEFATALWQLGWSRYVAGRWHESIEASREALQLDPLLLPVKFNLALALLRAGELDQATTEYESASDAVDEAWDLKHYGIKDLKAALAEDSELPGGEEILASLKRRYEELKAGRESSGRTPGRLPSSSA